MKKKTIHLSRPAGSQPPELHAAVTSDIELFLARRASASGTQKTKVASMILGTAAAADNAGKPADMVIELRWLPPGSEDIAEAIAAAKADACAISGARVALLSSRVPASAAARAERERRLAAHDKALAEVAGTMGRLEMLAGLSPGGLAFDVVSRALAQQDQPDAPAPAEPAPAGLPHGVTREDLETAAARLLRPQTPVAWLFAALVMHALGREFSVPRPAGPLARPAPAAPSLPATLEGAQ